ncbi:synaptotagmin-like protein 2 isoform X2 [Struthio camelus]|uniref:synaptotagmin-like protein 2 isoform X2 n=1 Tax=Struthio camelus TaxID=8801 RepID=UPI00360411C2
MDGKTQVTKELSFGKTEKLKSVSPPACISEDIQLIKERRKPKQTEKNEKENDKSLTEFDCRRAKEKEFDQEIMKQNQKSSLLEHQEYEQPAQRCESEKAIREKRRIREIRAFWEREKTIPSHGEKEASVGVNASDGSMLDGLKKSDNTKPTTVYLPNGLDDQSNNKLPRTELSGESQASGNEYQNSFEFGSGHAIEKLERTLLSGGKVHECTKLPKGNNLQPRVGVTSSSPESKYKDGREIFQGKGVSCSQEKPNFKILSLKEKMNEKSKNQISNPSQFQSLRNFWDTGVKLQSSIDEGDVSLPNNTSSVTYRRESKEDKKSGSNPRKQELIQRQTQASEREKTDKLDSIECERPLESPTFKGLNMTQRKNTDSVQLVRKAFISKPKGNVDLPEQEAKEFIEKSTVSSKEHQNTFNSGVQKLPQVSLQLFQSPDDKDALKQEVAIDDQLCLSAETMENKTTPLDVDLPKGEVVETVDKFVLSKAEVHNIKEHKNIRKNIKENTLKQAAFHLDQYIVFERMVEQNHDIFPADQREEIRESSEKMDVPSTDKDENTKKGLGKLFGEFEPSYPQHQAEDKDKTLRGSSDFFQSPFPKVLYTDIGGPGGTKIEEQASARNVSETARNTLPPKLGDRYGYVDLQRLHEASEVSPSLTVKENVTKLLSDTVTGHDKERPYGRAIVLSSVKRREPLGFQHQEHSNQQCDVKKTVEKIVQPNHEHNELKAGLRKLLREAFAYQPSESRGVEMKISDTMNSTSQTSWGAETTCQQDVAHPEEVDETVERSVAPSKSGGFSSALEKLLREASEPSPPEPESLDRAVPRAAEMPAASVTCQRGAESPQEIRETVERSVAPSKSGGFSSALEKLLREASEPSPPEPESLDRAVPRAAEMPAASVTCQRGAESPQEIRETVERSVAPSKSGGFSSALEKLLREASEPSPPEPESLDRAVPRAAEMPAASVTCQRGAESPQEIRETVERSVAPSKSGGFSSALEKLLREASEPSPPEPESLDRAVPRAAEMPAASVTCQRGAESPQEIRETVERSVAPSKSGGFSSALEKLLREASEPSPPEPESLDRAVPRAAEMPAASVTCQRGAESPQEIRETVERSVAPSKSGGFSSALEKLLREASEPSPPEPESLDRAVPRAAEMPAASVTCQRGAESPQEIRETVERSVAPSKSGGFSSALEKLLREASEPSPPEPESLDRAVPRAAEMPAASVTCQRGAESPQEIRETVERSVAPSKSGGFSSALEKLLREASEPSPPEPESLDRAVPRAAEMPAASVTCQRGAESPQEIRETVERSVAPSKFISEMQAPILKNMDKKMQDKILTSQGTCAPFQHERDHPQEIKETIEKICVSANTNSSEVSSSLEKLLKEAPEYSSPISKELHVQGKFQDPMSPSKKDTLSMTVSQPYHNALSNYQTHIKIGINRKTLEPNSKSSIVDHVVNEAEASDVPKRDVTLHKREERNMAPTDVLPFERETKTITIKSLKINEKIRTGESTSLIASGNNSESKSPLKFRRASTPLKDERSSPQPEATELCLTSCLENEEEGSEEELNPVLMALKRSADRKVPSKSLEDIPSATSNKGKINIPKEELALSAEDVSTVPSQPDKLFSNPEKLKGLSKSVPSFLQEESDDRETDTASESSYSFGRIKKSPSSLTNLSSSSGMASLSSVSGSLMSIYSGDFGNVDVKGNIQFAIDYVEQLKELHIFICQCKDLAVADVKQQRSDPYVKTYLLPEKYKLGKRKTSVKKKTFNPVYNEILRYKIEKAVLKNQRLNISVWHNDTFGRNSFLGEVELDLGTWDWNDKTNKQINWFPLKPRASAMALELENRGEMKLALQYVPQPVGGKKIPSTGEVHIWVKECHDLPLLRGNRLNSFIKCTILPDTSRKSRQKTRTVAKTTNPVFNHTMVYDGFRPEDLKEACVELTVWHHNKLANHFLGGLRIGLGTGKSYGTTVDWMDSTSDETALWEKMMNSPNTWIEDTLPLRMLMVAKLTK